MPVGVAEQQALRGRDLSRPTHAGDGCPGQRYWIGALNVGERDQVRFMTPELLIPEQSAPPDKILRNSGHALHPPHPFLTPSLLHGTLFESTRPQWKA